MLLPGSVAVYNIALKSVALVIPKLPQAELNDTLLPSFELKSFTVVAPETDKGLVPDTSLASRAPLPNACAITA